LKVSKAEIVNLMEDHVAEVKLESDVTLKKHDLKLDFRGFEIKTVRLTVEVPSENEGWVKV